MLASKTRVLYIDDDPGLCRLVQKDLEREGYLVEIAMDGEGGLARAARGGIDIIALDHSMPGHDGLATLFGIRALSNPPPVIYVTAMQEIRIAVAALRAGATDYVTKAADGHFLTLLRRAIVSAENAIILRRAKEAAEADGMRNLNLAESIVATIRDPLVVLEHDMTIVTASQSFLTMFGLTDAEARGRHVSALGQHDWYVPALRHLLEKVLPENKPIESFEIENDFPGLGRRAFNLNARKISRPGNHVHRLLLVFEDITDRKQLERDAGALANEVSHRIKNNLQIVIGMISYEAHIGPSPCAQGYRAIQGRIGAIAKLYDLIAQSGRIGAIGLDSYLREIAETLSASLLADNSGIKIEVHATAMEIDPNRAVPFGLLVNELATNAVKHAFPDGKGCIVLSISREADDIELSVADDGVGVKVKAAVKLTERRGTDFVAIFVRQLGGRIIPSRSAAPGTTVRIRFPFDGGEPHSTKPLAA